MMVYLNWALVILCFSDQVSLMVIYSLGLFYHASFIFRDYKMIMMYINIICTCASQVILAFIFAMVSK